MDNRSPSVYIHLPFKSNFQIQEYIVLRDEVYCYLLSIEKSEVKSEMEGYILLQERLKYCEDELLWEEKSVIQNRIGILNQILHYSIENGDFRVVSSDEASQRINQLDIEINYKDILISNSKNLVIYDDWNLYELFGENENDYYLFIWYTTA